MKNKSKKRTIDEMGAVEELKNANSGSSMEKKNKKLKKAHLNTEHLSKKIDSNLPKSFQTDNTSVLKKAKKNKNHEGGKSDTEKLKDLKARQAKREKRKQARKEHGQYKVSESTSVEVMKQRIAEIESRENLTKTAKRKLRIFKKKLLIAEGDISAPPSENVSPKLTKSQKKKLKQEKLNSQNISELQVKDKKSFVKDNIEKEIETSFKKENMKTKIKKSEKKKKVQIEQNSKLFENEDSSEEDNDKSQSTGNESDNSSGESSQLVAEKETINSNEENDSSAEEADSNEEEDEEVEENTESAESENENTGKEVKKKTSQKAVDTPKQRKNENNKVIPGQENAEKKKRYVLFVGNIPFQSTVEDIKKHFLQKVSNVVSVRIPTIKGSKKPRGFAYVEVTNNIDYEKALSLHHTNLEGFKIKVEYTQTGSKNIKNKQEVVAKNKKLHALRKAGKLAGSKKRNNQRNFRRKLQKNPGSKMNDNDN